MRRLKQLLVYALCIGIATPADAARVLVLVDPSASAHTKAVVSILSQINPGGFVVKHSCAPEINTERLRTGVFPEESFGAVIITGMGNSDCDGDIQDARTYVSDSLTLSARSPTVPHLWLGNQGAFVRDSYDSLGVSGIDNTTTAGGMAIRIPESGVVFSTNMTEGAEMTASEIPPGGVRKFLSRTLNRRGYYNAAATAMPCVDCDSANIISANATIDTVLIWSKRNAHVAGAKPIIGCIPSDFAGGDTEYAPEIVMMAMAILDSASGGAVFGTHPRTIDWGLQIRGGASRMTHASSGGFPPQDTATVYASIDSIASLNFPFVLAANPCSLQAYARDMRVWARAQRIHYTPYITNGVIDTAAAGNQVASYNVPADPFGRYRLRAAYGDGTWANKDTSLAALLGRAKAKMDSAYGASRVDRVLCAPWDDWSPKNTPSMGLDSLWGGFRSAGFVGVVANQRSRFSNPTAQGGGANPTGWWPQQRWEVTALINSGRFKVLATPGWMDSGSARFDNGAGSTGLYPYPTFDRYEMFWRGLLMGATMPQRGSSQYHRKLADSTDGRVSIYTIHVGDLGKGVHTSGRATRPGWWQVKYLVNATRTINKFAGRELVRIRYPEEINP